MHWLANRLASFVSSNVSALEAWRRFSKRISQSWIPYLDDAQLSALFGALREAFSFGTEATREFALEADPRTVSAERLVWLAELGFNRVS